MHEFQRNLKSDAKKSWPYILALALVEFVVLLFEHRILGDINDYIDANSGPILNSVRPFSIWIVRSPLALLITGGCVVFIHALLSSLREPQPAETDSYSPTSVDSPIKINQQANPQIAVSPQIKQEANPHIEVNPQFHIYSPTEAQVPREPLQRKQTPAPIPAPPSHNILFLGGHRYNPDKHGLLGGPRESDMVRIALAEFRNKHVIGSTVGHAYDVQAGITYKGSEGEELRYVSPGKWLMRDGDTVELKSGAESEFVILATYNYSERRWETSKAVFNAQWDGHFYTYENRPLPFGVIVADVALLKADGTALKGGSVTFELKPGGEFVIN